MLAMQKNHEDYAVMAIDSAIYEAEIEIKILNDKIDAYRKAIRLLKGENPLTENDLPF